MATVAARRRRRAASASTNWGPTSLTHRRIAPYGLDGGSDGTVGAARIERADGDVTELAATDAADVESGDVLVVETPGGGGYGAPDPAG
ncbi:MAG: hydantoinase B/oxoprolinase family protein [Ilumatobacteraceae bacterium]